MYLNLFRKVRKMSQTCGRVSLGLSYAFRMNGLADPFWANFERFLVVLWPPFEKGVRSDLIQIVCKDTATFSENLIKFIQRLEVFIDDGLVGQRP